jgi:hypothetical protein
VQNADTHVALTAEIHPYSVLTDRFLQLAAGEGYWHLRGLRWSTDMEEAPLADDAIASIRHATNDAHEVILEVDDALVQLNLSSGKATVRVAGSELIDVESAVAWIRQLIPESAPHDRQEAEIEFWTWGEYGPESISRNLAVPRWKQIASNYASETRLALERLMALRPEQDGGRLMLWHGAPGTGKTHALRAMAWAWREWCDVHYITDPETFFGEKPSYMLRLLMANDDPDPADERWRLLVLEDTGELMRVDAKDHVGQGLSRLLNLVDGMIGQGFPVLVLVTTNEPLGALHAAVARPGRCMSNVEFAPLPVAQATAWLRARGAEQISAGKLTLAECYAVLAGEQVPVRRPVGFVA